MFKDLVLNRFFFFSLQILSFVETRSRLVLPDEENSHLLVSFSIRVLLLPTLLRRPDTEGLRSPSDQLK